jgi:hypothetical protein
MQKIPERSLNMHNFGIYSTQGVDPDENPDGSGFSIPKTQKAIQVIQSPEQKMGKLEGGPNVENPRFFSLPSLPNGTSSFVATKLPNAFSCNPGSNANRSAMPRNDQGFGEDKSDQPSQQFYPSRKAFESRNFTIIPSTNL